MTNTTTRGTMGTKTTKIRIGTTFTRNGAGYPDGLATVVERQRGRRGDASRTMYVLANSSGHRQEAIGRETLLKLMGR